MVPFIAHLVYIGRDRSTLCGALCFILTTDNLLVLRTAYESGSLVEMCEEAFS
jgi:hypothetical protein